jgi:hypothetical protein
MQNSFGILELSRSERELENAFLELLAGSSRRRPKRGTNGGGDARTEALVDAAPAESTEQEKESAS